MKHRESHPDPVDGCFGCKLLAVQLGIVSPTTIKERDLSKDMGAYKHLRRDGLQPKQIDGCAELESRATDRFEVELGHLIPDKDKPAVREGLQAAKEMA